MKRQAPSASRRQAKVLPELPEGRPRPEEANPGGIEGADPGWAGGQSGLILGPELEGDTTYSTSQVDSAGRVDVVRTIHCEKCGEGFQSLVLLNVHRKREHGPQTQSKSP
ncbi:MAG: hypothetical protein E6J20_14375 [Chloroflexi bacterium]|nr:MAG: hypothetical protein E6J20_14375 [Chloroflexota bacterium]